MVKPSCISPQHRDYILMLYQAPYHMSAGAIAERLGVTKGVVSGILHRAGRAGDVVLRRDQGPGPIATVTGVRHFTPHPEGQRRARPATTKEKPMQDALVADQAAPAVIHEPPPPPVETVFRGRRQAECKWPIGEPGTPDFRFCCEAAEAGKPYCTEHRVRSLDLRKMAALREQRRLRRMAA